MFVAREADSFTLAVPDFEGDYFSIKPSRFNRGLSTLLRAQCILILFLTRDLMNASEILSCLTHHESGERIVEAVAIHSVNQLRVTHAHTPASALSQIRHARHTFSAASKNQFRAAE